MGRKILVVGAGFAGATYARELAESGWKIDVIDQRPHIGGNAYDEVDATGVRVHKYGPHLFHTNNERVVAWISRFGNFIPYEHRVNALLHDGSRVPLPINRHTINMVFDKKLANEAEVVAFLSTQVIRNDSPANAADYLMAGIGKTLTNLFFRPYTRKMWALDLEDLDAAVVKRIPIRYDDEDRYFPKDRFQLLPTDGYTQIFASIFDHPNIRVSLGVDFDKSMLSSYFHCFNSMPIDSFYDEEFGPLPYRSIRFHNRVVSANYGKNEGIISVLNYTDGGPLTRETDWSKLPRHQVINSGKKTVTQEEPCDYTDNGLQRYYPVKTSDGRYDAVYQNYAHMAEKNTGITFIGRCGTYQYLDMDQVINQSVQGSKTWIKLNS